MSESTASTQAFAHWEPLLQEFSAAWQRGDRPSIDDFRRGTPALSLLVELTHLELECRLGVNEPLRVEEYVQRYPDVARDVPGLLKLIAVEYRSRCRHEGQVCVEEFERRFSELAPHLGQALRAAGEAPSSAGTPHRPARLSDAAASAGRVPDSINDWPRARGTWPAARKRSAWRGTGKR